MKRRWFILLVWLAFVEADAAVFEQKYTQVPLYEVLQDIEQTFGVAFMYKPADIAAAPCVSGVFHSNDCLPLLQKILPPAMECVRKKSILVLVKKAESQAEQQQTFLLHTTVPDISLQTDTLPPAQTAVIIPMEYLRPNAPVCVHIAPRQIELCLPEPQFHSQEPPTLKSLGHAFVPSVSVGYGSCFHFKADLLYRLRFHSTFAFSMGLNAACLLSAADAYEIGLGLPVNVHYIRSFRSTIPHLAGWQASVGFMPYFPVAYFGGTITTIDVDLVPSVGLDLLFDNTKVLGLYGQCSALNAVPWSVGIRFAYIIGDK